MDADLTSVASFARAHFVGNVLTTEKPKGLRRRSERLTGRMKRPIGSPQGQSPERLQTNIAGTLSVPREALVLGPFGLDASPRFIL